MKFKILILTWGALFFFIIAVGCGSSSSIPSSTSEQPAQDEWDPWGNYPELGEGTATYECLPLSTSYFYEVLPLGHLSPPGHPIPTDHIYFILNRAGETNAGFSQPVKAPAAGVITTVERTTWASGEGYEDYSITITHTNTFKTIFMHLSGIDAAILARTGSLETGEYTVYLTVEAGDMIGKTSAASAQSACLDMTTLDKNTTLNFIDTSKYDPLASHAVCPIDHFTASLQDTLYQTVSRTASPRGGKIDFDQANKLVGNWFLDGVSSLLDDGVQEKSLAFVYDVYDPSYLRISVGGTLLSAGLFRVKGNAPDPADVSITGSEEVVYKLIVAEEGEEFMGSSSSEESVSCTLLVKSVGSAEIEVEMFSGEISDPVFTSNAKYYIR